MAIYKDNRKLQELELFFANLAGKHIEKNPNDKSRPSSLQDQLGIDCCDVVAGDCNTGQCV